jgi:ribulose-bisphosphate carboxylase large chain
MTWITATYRIRAASADLDDLARSLALEQSVELPAAAVTDAYVRDHVMGRVAGVRPGADGVHLVDLQLATATTGHDVAQTLNMLFGNASLHPNVELVDVDFPAEFLAAFTGPRFGVAGIRAQLGVPERPLACAALKPQGLPSAALATLCHTLAVNGVDIVKDDHGLADQAYAPFAERVNACQAALVRAMQETGRRCLYAPSLVGSPEALALQARIARDAGVGAVLVAPALVGMPVFQALVARELDIPVIAHPAMAGATRIAPPLLLGKLFRWLGADAMIFPNFGGRFDFDEATCGAIAAHARSVMAGYRVSLPVPAGGLALDRVDELVAFYGCDVMLLIGGALLGAGDVGARTREFVAALECAPRDGRTCPAAA